MQPYATSACGLKLLVYAALKLLMYVARDLARNLKASYTGSLRPHTLVAEGLGIASLWVRAWRGHSCLCQLCAIVLQPYSSVCAVCVPGRLVACRAYRSYKENAALNFTKENDKNTFEEFSS